VEGVGVYLTSRHGNGIVLAALGVEGVLAPVTASR
jgi:hypothetical protein